MFYMYMVTLLSIKLHNIKNLKEGEGDRSLNFREVRSMFVECNMGLFQNKLGDIYDEAFHLTEDKRKQKERKKSWLENRSLGR
jgi:uncharacterized protein YhfF